MSTSTILNSGGQVVLCFGSNFFGQLGIGRLVRQSSSSPCAFGSPSVEVIDAIRSGDIADIQCGAEFTVVLYKDGRLMICGTLNGNVSPTLSNIAVSYPLKCSQVRCGRKHILALMEGGFVLSWGIGELSNSKLRIQPRNCNSNGTLNISHVLNRMQVISAN